MVGSGRSLRTRAPLRLLLGIDVACALSGGTDAHARGDPAVTVSGACPEPAALDRVLATLLPASTGPRPDAPITVSDLGDTYRVSVGGRAKTYADPSRDCTERARVAAAFIALALSPDAPPAPAATPPAPAPPAPPPPPPPVTVPGRWLRVDARGAVGVAPEDGLVTAGAALSVAAGSRIFGGHLACGWLAAVPLSLSDGTSVLIERFPCALGPTARIFPRPNRLEVDFEPGLALGALVASGRGFTTTFQSARLEVGARVAVDATLHLGPSRSGIAPVLGLEATVYPVAYDLDVGSRGTVAQSPRFWAGVTAGVCWTME